MNTKNNGKTQKHHTITARAPDQPNFVWRVTLGFVGVENTGQSPHTAANTTRTNRMEIQIFDNQTTDKTRTRRPPTPLTSLAEMKITAQLTIMTTKHMRLLSSTGGGAALLRWPSVAVYLRSGTYRKERDVRLVTKDTCRRSGKRVFQCTGGGASPVHEPDSMKRNCRLRRPQTH